MKAQAIMIVVFIVLMGLALTGCKPREKAVLRMGTGGEYPPFSYMQNNQFMGVDIEIGRRIADKMNMELKIIQIPFDSMFPSLASNKIDMAIDAISITEERKQMLDYSAPYYTANQVIIAKTDSPIQINQVQELGKYSVGCQTGTTGAEYVKENLVDKDLLPRQNYREYTTNVEALGDLLSGKVDLIIIDNTAATGYSKQKPLRIIYTIRTNEQYAVVMQKGKMLNEKISKAMDEMLASGEIKAILETNIR